MKKYELRQVVCGLVALFIMAGALTILGCDDDDDDDDVVCTTEARASVMATVIDVSGAPLAGATVTYRVDGGDALEAECFELPDDCTVFVAGYEVAGDFTIVAAKEGFQPAEVFVTVDMDEFGCHVITQEVELTLLPE